MKKFMITIAFVSFVSTAFSFAYEEGYTRVTLSDIQGKNWHLTEVKRGYNVIAAIDRTNVPKDIYTIRFEANRLAGIGAPNTYFAAYSIGEDFNLSIWGIGSTRVSPIFQMKVFSENEYFKCLKSVDTWYKRGENLILYTYPEDDFDNPLILVFS
jgi:heat shock protein HslJ